MLTAFRHRLAEGHTLATPLPDGSGVARSSRGGVARWLHHLDDPENGVLRSQTAVASIHVASEHPHHVASEHPHCLLLSRQSTSVSSMRRPELPYLPLAWYVPEDAFAPCYVHDPDDKALERPALQAGASSTADLQALHLAASRCWRRDPTHHLRARAWTRLGGLCAL